MRLAADGAEVGPLGLLPNVSVIMRMAAEGAAPGEPLRPVALPQPTAGPLKILAAVAAPDETKSRNSPLDVEAEMAAVLDATSEVAAGAHAQVRILEVASLAAIREALAKDAYHVLHLSAHGSPEAMGTRGRGRRTGRGNIRCAHAGTENQRPAGAAHRPIGLLGWGN